MRFLNFNSDLMSVIAAAITAAILTFYVIRTTRFGKFLEGKRRQHVVAGTVFHQLFNFNRLHDFTTDLSRKHKTYRILSFFRSEVYTADPVNVQYILKTNFANYAKGWYHYSVLTDLLGDGIFTVDGEKWRHQRKLATYEISNKALREFSLQVFKSNAVKLGRVVSEAAMSNKATDFQDLFMKTTLDSVFKIVFGVELDTMCGTYEEGMKFSIAFENASAITLHRYVDFIWRLKRFLNIGSEAELRNNIKVVDEFVYKLIKNKTEQVLNPQDNLLVRKGDLVSRFLEVKETDPKYLRDIILSFMIAGKDTTASTLSWFLYMLCKHPHKQEKIFQEIKQVTELKDSSSIEEIAASITEEILEKMHYLHAALTETLRLYPAIPLDGKFCLSDDTWPDGYSVKKGDVVAYQPYAMGRMKFIWGDDAEDFRPERWHYENGIFKPESPFKFTAFQAGPRICLGKDFAYRQMKIFAAVLLLSHKFKLADPNKSVNYRTMLSLHIDGGLHLLASKRSKA